MASTYTTRLRLEKQATGENANTWGDKTNSNFDLILFSNHQQKWFAKPSWSST